MKLIILQFTATRMQKLARLPQTFTMMEKEMLIFARANQIATHIMRIHMMEIAIIAVEIRRDLIKRCSCLEYFLFVISRSWFLQ